MKRVKYFFKNFISTLLIDLHDDFSKSPYVEVSKFFIYGREHYTEKGNQFVADLLYKKLLSFDEIKRKIAVK